ncbi:MAG: NADPH:quinone oxidoreductase family protein, partial [Alphaproteobacteria bacterium]
MKAVLCKAPTGIDDLVVEDVPSPRPGKGEVLIAVQAAGVNFPDMLIVQGKYQFKPDPPFSPGGELAGEVIALGEGVTDFAVGDRVAAMTVWGAFAEQVVVPARNLVRIPDAMDYETAAALFLTYGTAYHALRQRGNLAPGETLLVLGAAGGVGLAAVQLGKVLGARVIAAAGAPEKLEVAREAGADHLVDYTTESLRDQVRALTGGKGADVIFDPVGGDAFQQSMSAINWNGRLLVVGFASGEIPKLAVNRVLLKGCAVVGVFWGAFTEKEAALNAANNRDLLRFWEEGKIRPLISASYPLEKARDALRQFETRKVVG